MDPHPLHQPSGDPDETWGSRLDISCACGKTHPLWNRSCPGCRTKNPLKRLIKKRNKIDRWLDRTIESAVVPAMEKTGLLEDIAKSFDNNLAEVIRRPFPERRKNEDLNKFLKRVSSFFPTMFKTTAPRQVALKMNETVPRAASAIARTAFSGSLSVLGKTTRSAFHEADAKRISRQGLRVNQDLLELTKPYLEALQTLQLSHSRMVTAYGPVKDVFRREVDTTRARALWNKARSMLSSSGQVIRLPTAIWKDAEELEKIKRLDTNLAKFLEQAGHFHKQRQRLAERTEVLYKTYRLSLRRFMAGSLLARASQASLEERSSMARALLSQKGVGSWLWRMLFGAKGT